jgi:putative nucleotidyltransferase with HDIG domain
VERRTAVAYRPPTAFAVDEGPSADSLVPKVRLRIARDLASGKVEIPPFPKVALELHKIASSRVPDLALACKLIQREVDLAGRMVKAACSPIFGSKPVDTLDAAAMRLGVEGVRDVAMMAAMGRLMRASPFVGLAREITIHSFTVAVLTQWICEANALDKKQGFLCGLFHDVGRLALIVALEQYGRTEPIYLEPDVVQVISDDLHAQVGAVVLSSWGMHTIAKRIAERHHEPLKVTGPDVPIVRAVAIADAADKLVALDIAERTLRLSVDPVVVAGNLSSELVEQLAAGVDTIRADEMLNAMTA